MKILFIHEVSWFKKPVFEMHDFPELLSLRGHEVSFIEYDEGKCRTRWRTLTSLESRAWADSRVVVITPPRFLPGIFGRILATIIQPFIFWRLVTVARPDVVVTYSVPTSGWQVIAICKMMHIPTVARIIDIAHVLRESRLSALIKQAEKYVYKNATFVSCNNEFLRNYCVENGASAEKSSVTYPGVDFTQFFPGEKNQSLMKTLQIQPSDRVLMYMGTVYRFSGLVEILHELSTSLKENPSLKFLVIGAGEDLPRLLIEARLLGLQEQIISVGNIEHSLLPDYLRLGDVALLPFKPELVAHAALSGKVLKYLAVGVPAVSTDLMGLKSAIHDGEGVIYCSGYSNFALSTIGLLENPHKCQQLSTEGLYKIARMCNWQVQIDEFTDILTSVSARTYVD